MIEELLKELIGALPSRAQDVLARRFGMKNNQPETLEEIGASYDITRERVRQIESLALAQVKKLCKNPKSEFHNFEKLASDYLEKSGGARQESKFLKELKFLFNENHVGALSRMRFLLSLSSNLHLVEETKRSHPFWVNSASIQASIINFLDVITRELAKKNFPIPIADTAEFLRHAAEKSKMSHFPIGALAEFAQISKEVAMSPHGEWGLVKWGAIVPDGVRDRAYFALKQRQKPLHFKELADFLNDHARLAVDFHPAWQRQIAVQTVHNELIKDQRFVLVGRGTYALAEWGYKPGTVKEVIIDIFQEAGGQPMSKEEILQKVRERRVIQDATVLINLQDGEVFQRLGDGRYRLRDESTAALIQGRRGSRRRMIRQESNHSKPQGRKGDLVREV